MTTKETAKEAARNVEVWNFGATSFGNLAAIDRFCGPLRFADEEAE